jgi:intracellular multiplication protein IcmV
MGFKSILKKGVSGGVSPKQWIGFGQIKGDTVKVSKIAKAVFKREKHTERKETFEEAMKRFDLSEDDIKKRMKTSKQLVFIFLGISALLAFYMTYQWVSGHFIGGFICMVLMSLILSYAFREHFNLFQMRQRRLGCTCKEWLKSTFKGSK